MKKHNILLISTLALLLSNCGGKKNNTNSLFKLEITNNKEQYQWQETIELSVSNTQSKEIDSIAYFNNDKKIGSIKGLGKLKFALKDQKLGYQNIKAIVYFEGETENATARIELVSNIVPKLLKYKLIKTYPHDIASFTEGLEFYKDTLYESTGLNGSSYLRKYDYKTGKIYKQINLDSIYFGEGITILNNKIYQLTWKNKKGFIYNLKTLQLEKSFVYDKDIEGWGLTNDGTYLYQTDKTEKIWKMDPKTQKMIDYVNVYAQNSKIPSINELEWIDNKIYTNVWLKDAIAIVDPTNGAVEAILDFSDLRKLTHAKQDDVLNGIAYNPKTKNIFITGKNWDKLFEITVLK